MSARSINLGQFRTILDENLVPLKSDISDLNGKLEETKAFLDMANDKYEEIMTKLAQSDAGRKEILIENKILKSTIQIMESHVKQLKESMDDLEQYLRRECLEIQGIPIEKTENTNVLVKQIGVIMIVIMISVYVQMKTTCSILLSSNY